MNTLDEHFESAWEEHKTTFLSMINNGLNEQAAKIMYFSGISKGYELLRNDTIEIINTHSHDKRNENIHRYNDVVSAMGKDNKAGKKS